MREGKFIQRSRNRWKAYETPTGDPDELAQRFSHLVDDLSYAKTFYPTSNTTKYLNGLAANIFLSIYRARKEKRNRLITFWTIELPLLYYRHRAKLFYALLFFTGFSLIGAFSASQDQTFIRAILGDTYVDMTEQNIADGNPFGVYQRDNTTAMFAYIALNNIGVSFKVFAAGILPSIGTIWLLLKNGIMMGAFQYMFIQHGLGTKFILVVFLHGVLELSAVVIAAGAGLTLGNSILFPKTYTRVQSLQRGAKDGIKMLIGLIPVFLVAAFFETYVTRYANMPVALSLLILTGSSAFVIFYFILLPKKVAHRAGDIPLHEEARLPV